MTDITHPMVSIYTTAAKGDCSRAWYNYTNYLNEGITNPRAKLLDIAIGEKELAKRAKCTYWTRKNKQGKLNAEIFMIEYEKLIKRVFGTGKEGHFCVKDAYTKLQDAFKEMYPNKKVRRLSKFVMFKQKHPILGKIKLLARFI